MLRTPLNGIRNCCKRTLPIPNFHFPIANWSHQWMLRIQRLSDCRSAIASSVLCVGWHGRPSSCRNNRKTVKLTINCAVNARRPCSSQCLVPSCHLSAFMDVSRLLSPFGHRHRRCFWLAQPMGGGMHMQTQGHLATD